MPNLEVDGAVVGQEVGAEGELHKAKESGAEVREGVAALCESLGQRRTKRAVRGEVGPNVRVVLTWC